MGLSLLALRQDNHKRLLVDKVFNDMQKRKALSLDTIHRQVHRIRSSWPSMPPVNVVASVYALPFECNLQADGAYYDGEVYVVASNVFDVKQLQKVIAHECVMHHGLEKILGNYGFSKLHHGIQDLIADGDQKICALAEDILARYGPLSPKIQSKEIVARAGEQCLDSEGNISINFGFMKSVFAGVTDWLRDHGFTIPFTNFELQGILHTAGKWVKQEPIVDTEVNLVESTYRSGWFSGKVLGITNGVVTQKIGRGEQTVSHSLDNLSSPVTVGQIIDVQYKNGIGLVCDKDQISKRLDSPTR